MDASAPTPAALPLPVGPAPLLSYARTMAPGEVRAEADAEGASILIGSASLGEVLLANAHWHTALLIAYSPVLWPTLWLVRGWAWNGVRPDLCSLLFVAAGVGFAAALYSGYVTTAWARRVTILRVSRGHLAISYLNARGQLTESDPFVGPVKEVRVRPLLWPPLGRWFGALRVTTGRDVPRKLLRGRRRRVLEQVAAHLREATAIGSP